ncbi:hypothetical protein IQ255_05160 [Pleurocapsales cyanobacterium LEGE 10410]|nr:hypothetical protein [Pleurocapsales cyanobacterium LEGE 10410]
MMNTPDKNRGNRLPQWQSERMRTLIEERWTEVWKIVIARERSAQNLHRKSSRRNLGFLNDQYPN